MKKTFKFTSVLLVIMMLLVTVTGCSSKKQEEDTTKVSISASISHDEKYDSVIVEISPEDFMAAGFNFGDSCDVTFSNGYTLTDIPFYNGYYVKTGDAVVVAYPGNTIVKVARNSADCWTPAGVDESCTVEITLNTAGKYLATYEALGIPYSNERSDFDSDEMFANFRAISGGNLKENLIYRGASPVNNETNRASYVDALLEKNGINCVLDLADSQDNMDKYLASEDFASNYTKSLYEDGKVILLSMSSSYYKDSYKASVAEAVRYMLNNEGPVYIHCNEGKDRTGFVCMLLEALMSASYDEMCQDYMTTYYNYYGITKEDTPEKYDAVVDLYFNSFMSYLYGSDDVEVLKSADYSESARNYLTECGLTTEEIDSLVTYLSK